MSVLRGIILFVRAMLHNRTDLAAENLALRQQLAILEHKSKRPRQLHSYRSIGEVGFWTIIGFSGARTCHPAGLIAIAIIYSTIAIYFPARQWRAEE